MLKQDAYKKISMHVFGYDDMPKQILELLDEYKISSQEVVDIFLRKLNEDDNNRWTLQHKTEQQKHGYMKDYNSGIPTAKWYSDWGIAYSDEKLDSIIFVDKITGAVIPFAQMPSEFWQGKTINSKLFKSITLNDVLNNEFNNDYLSGLLFDSYLEALSRSNFKLTVFNKLKNDYKRHLEREKPIVSKIKESEKYIAQYEKKLIELYSKAKKVESSLEITEGHEHHYPSKSKDENTDFVTFLRNTKLIKGYGLDIVDDLKRENSSEDIFFDELFNYYFTKENGSWYYRLNGTANLDGKTSSGTDEATLEVPFKDVKAPVNDSLSYLFDLFDTLIRKCQIYINDGSWNSVTPDKNRFWELLEKYKTSFPENYILVADKHEMKLSTSIEMIREFLEKLQIIKEMASYENLSSLINSDKRSRDNAIGNYLKDDKSYHKVYDDEPWPFSGPAYDIEKGNYGKNSIQFEGFYGNEKDTDYIREISSWITDIASYYIEIFEYILYHNESLKDYGVLANYRYFTSRIKELMKSINEESTKIKQYKAKLSELDSKEFVSHEILMDYYNTYIKDSIEIEAEAVSR